MYLLCATEFFSSLKPAPKISLHSYGRHSPAATQTSCALQAIGNIEFYKTLVRLLHPVLLVLSIKGFYTICFKKEIAQSCMLTCLYKSDFWICFAILTVKQKPKKTSPALRSQSWLKSNFFVVHISSHAFGICSFCREVSNHTWEWLSFWPPFCFVFKSNTCTVYT